MTGIDFLSNEGLKLIEGKSMDEATLVLYVILYVLLPLWGLASMLDWWCHKKTSIESTSGLHEANIHCLMGFQIAIPLVLSLVFEVNVLVLLLCFAALVAHEFIAITMSTILQISVKSVFGKLMPTIISLRSRSFYSS